MPAQDREAVIKITAKNLTEEEFKKVKKGLKGIGQSAAGTNKEVGTLQRGFSTFSKAAPGALKIVTAAAVATAASVVAIAAAVIKLGDRGSKVIALSTSFDRLTTAVGETGAEMIAVTRKATKGLVSDLEIMKAANKGLLLGLPITTTEMGNLAETALVLGRAMGLDATKSLDDLITALGRSSPMILDNLGITVKLGDANIAFAKKLGVSSKSLTEAQRKTAFYEETLRVAKIKVEELGGVQLTLGDLFEQSRTKVTNFVDGLAKMIAKSPVLMAGFTSISESIKAAFGGEQQSIVLGITNLIEKAAIAAITFGISAVESASAVVKSWGGIQVLILGVTKGFVFLAQKMAEQSATQLELASKIPLLGRAYVDVAAEARAAAVEGDGMLVSMNEQIEAAALAALGNTELGITLEALRQGLIKGKAASVNAGVSQRELNVATTEGTTAITGIGVAAVITNEQLRAAYEAIQEGGGHLSDMSDAAILWSEDMNTATTEILSGQELVRSTFSQTGIQIGGVASSIQAAFTRMGISTRDQLKQTADQAVEDYERILKSGLATNEALEESERKMQEARRAFTGETTKAKLTSNQLIFKATTQMLQSLGRSSKSAAIASAVIGTAVAVVQALRSGPPPGSWILAATNAALGAIQIAAIKSAPAFRHGTSGLDFQEFGTQTPTFLHGKEAVIPQGKGHMLAREIADAMGRRGQGNDPALTMALGELRASLVSLRNLPREMQRAMRDGIQLAAL